VYFYVTVMLRKILCAKFPKLGFIAYADIYDQYCVGLGGKQKST